MPYLIDGHNLIGQLPDVDLSDPDDEMQLIYKLRSFAGRVRKKITVVFDNGLPAGIARNLSTHSVQVRFASEKSSADQVLRDTIRKTRNPKGWTLVSSDIGVTDLAHQRGMNVITSHQFAPQLSPPPAKPQKARQRTMAVDSRKVNPRLSQAEIDEWLTLFNANSDER